ncbi:MAG TPA: BON domain-containing protein, partial [Methylomirabilota bacterium]|nr:BON domain-containing protein [Methylomirabilota bacterium]
MDAHGRLRTHRARRYAGALLALLLALPFSGCVTMAALAVWNTATDERSVGEQAGDGRIATRIRLALLDTDIKAVAALSVFSHRGHVVLVGAVPADSPVARQAVATARGVAGVKRVDAYFYVNGRPSRYRDWVMGLEVRSNIIGDLSLKASQV